MNNNIGIIVCYFGKWPDFFPLFLKSIIGNKEIHWLIFSDNDAILPKHPNISFIKISKTEFNRLASQKTNLEIIIEEPYKLCDLKPLYGKIFEDYLLNYKFWGYSDIDVIYGQIGTFIHNDTLREYDIISTYQGFLSGPFCLFRNTDHINEFFRQSANFPGVIKSTKHFGFDENIQRSKIINISLHKIIKAIQFSFQYLLIGKLTGSSWKEFRYQFQWFYKRKTIRAGELADMTEVVWFYSKQLKIKTYFSELMLSDRYFNRINNKSWELVWDNGKLIEKSNGKNIMAFHLIDLKNTTSLEASNYTDSNGRFLITPKGIRIE